MLGELVLAGEKARDLLLCCNVAQGFLLVLGFCCGVLGVSSVMGFCGCVFFWCPLYYSYMLRCAFLKHTSLSAI